MEIQTKIIKPTLNDIYLMLIKHIGYNTICNDFIIPKDKIITKEDFTLRIWKLKDYVKKHYPICLDHFLLIHGYTNIKGEVLKTTSDINEFYNMLVMEYEGYQEYYYEPKWDDTDQWDDNGKFIHPSEKVLYPSDYSTPEMKEYFNQNSND